MDGIRGRTRLTLSNRISPFNQVECEHSFEVNVSPNGDLLAKISVGGKPVDTKVIKEGKIDVVKLQRFVSACAKKEFERLVAEMHAMEDEELLRAEDDDTYYDD